MGLCSSKLVRQVLLSAALAVGMAGLCYGDNAAVTVGWNTLKTLTDAGAAARTAPVWKLEGKVISIPGFMVPLEDDAQQVTEFLLVPYAGACIHVPPPPPNQMVYVKLIHNGSVKMSFTDPIVVTGVLKISNVKSPYGDVSYSIDGYSVKPYQE